MEGSRPETGSRSLSGHRAKIHLKCRFLWCIHQYTIIVRLASLVIQQLTAGLSQFSQVDRAAGAGLCAPGTQATAKLRWSQAPLGAVGTRPPHKPKQCGGLVALVRRKHRKGDVYCSCLLVAGCPAGYRVGVLRGTNGGFPHRVPGGFVGVSTVRYPYAPFCMG